MGEEQHDVVKSRILLLLDAVRAVPQVLAPMRSSCEYLTLIGAPDISVAILMLRKGCRIPCHSHPEMTVFTKILKGMALVHTYKILPADKTMAMPGVVATGSHVFT